MQRMAYNTCMIMILSDFVQGDIKPLNIVCGDAELEDNFIFKIMDYSCVGSKMNAHVQFSSK